VFTDAGTPGQDHMRADSGTRANADLGPDDAVRTHFDIFGECRLGIHQSAGMNVHGDAYLSGLYFSDQARAAHMKSALMAISPST
jgi:hypothetical protein